MTASLAPFHRRHLLGSTFAMLVAACAAGGVGRAADGSDKATAGPLPALDPARFMPVSEIRAGMVGEGLTVFQGTKPEPFKVRVVAVLPGFLPQQDIILIRVEDPRVEHTGVAAGMSGSPIYIGGRLVGALAYAWAFSKDPLAGVTPIADMIADSRRKPRPGGPTLTTSAPSVRDEHPPTPASLPMDGTQLQPLSVPLTISGVGAALSPYLREAFAPFGMAPVQGAGRGKGRAGAGAETLIPGGAVGVQLISGDMDATATGTVTYVDGNQVLAFGHRMMGAGEVEMPLVSAEIHTIMPSLASAFKMASPLQEVGALVQDRLSCIVGDLTRRAHRVPVSVTVRRQGETALAGGAPFRAEVARDERLTPVLISLVANAALTQAEPDPVDVQVDLRTRIVVAGMPPIEIQDSLFSTAGFSSRVLGASRALRALTVLTNNSFRKLDLESMDIDATLTFDTRPDEILAVRVSEARVRAGSTTRLLVTARTRDGDEVLRTYPLRIPRRLAGRTVEVEVASGDRVTPFVPKARTLKDLVATLVTDFTAANLVISIKTPESGAALRGQTIAGLPPAAMDTLHSALSSDPLEKHTIFQRDIIQAPAMFSGKAAIKLFIEDDPLGVGR